MSVPADVEHRTVLVRVPVLPSPRMRYSGGHLRPFGRRTAASAGAYEPIPGYGADIAGCEKAGHVAG